MTEIDDEEDTILEPPPAAEIDIRIGDKAYRVRYEKAFALGCRLLRQGQAEEASKLFKKLEEFTDRGPRAFIMQAFCEAAALHFDECSKPLAAVFDGESKQIATALHNAFVSYHVGIREDGLKSMADLVNKHKDLPTLCLLLGDMLEAAGRLPMAQKCWSLAVHRDWQGGAVKFEAMRRLRKVSDESKAAGDSSTVACSIDQA
jgi:hypothetical protein